jgi:hypothetical protein
MIEDYHGERKIILNEKFTSREMWLVKRATGQNVPTFYQNAPTFFQNKLL